MSEPTDILTLYTRVGCPLCEDMAVALRSLLAGTGHTVVSIDVDADPALKSAYGWDVPVLFAGEVELCRHELNLVAVQDWLRAHV